MRERAGVRGKVGHNFSHFLFRRGEGWIIFKRHARFVKIRPTLKDFFGRD